MRDHVDLDHHHTCCFDCYASRKAAHNDNDDDIALDIAIVDNADNDEDFIDNAEDADDVSFDNNADNVPFDNNADDVEDVAFDNNAEDVQRQQRVDEVYKKIHTTTPCGGDGSGGGGNLRGVDARVHANVGRFDKGSSLFW